MAIYIYAIDGNRQAAQYSGINVKLFNALPYVFSGVVCKGIIILLAVIIDMLRKFKKQTKNIKQEEFDNVSQYDRIDGGCRKNYAVGMYTSPTLPFAEVVISATEEMNAPVMLGQVECWKEYGDIEVYGPIACGNEQKYRTVVLP